jgi:pseudouridylate synthase / pseudouridine kinase
MGRERVGTLLLFPLRLYKLAHGADSRPHESHQVTGPASENFTTHGVSLGLGSNLPKEDTAPAKPIPPATRTLSQPADDTSDQASIFVAGSLNLDLSCDFTPRSTSSSSHTPELQTSNPATISQSLGGVGHNVARAAHLMGASVRLCSAVGDDLSGKAALDALATSGMSSAGVNTLGAESGSRTSQYIAVNDRNKDLVLAMADVSILEQTSSSSELVRAFEDFWLPQLKANKPTHLVLDANWPPEHLARWLKMAKDIGAHVTFEPVSNVKGAAIFQTHQHGLNLSVFPAPSLHLSTPNIHELSAMHAAARENGFFDRGDWWQVIDALGIPSSGARRELALATSPALVDQGIPQQSIQLLPFIPSICTKLGARGVLLTQLLPANDPRLRSGEYAPYILSRSVIDSEETAGAGGVYMRLFPPSSAVPAEEIVSVNGVGDTFAGTLVAGLAKHGKEGRVEDLIDLAQRAAVLTLKSKESVSPGLGTLRMLL